MISCSTREARTPLCGFFPSPPCAPCEKPLTPALLSSAPALLSLSVYLDSVTLALALQEVMNMVSESS